MTDAWQVMDDWCARQSEKLLVRTNPHVLKGCDLNDPEFRRLLGQSQALGRMRSFIHGTRNALAAGSRRAKTPKAVECEASQSGGEAVTPNTNRPNSISEAG